MTLAYWDPISAVRAAYSMEATLPACHPEVA
jgi:hypothetical protein